jgi:hypothetical protein
MNSHDKQTLEKLLDVIRVWIETESGPTYARFNIPSLKLTVTHKGYKKIVLERTFDAPQE